MFKTILQFIKVYILILVILPSILILVLLIIASPFIIKQFVPYYQNWKAFKIEVLNGKTKVSNSIYNVQFELNDVCYVDGKRSNIIDRLGLHLLHDKPDDYFFVLTCKNYKESIYVYIRDWVHKGYAYNYQPNYAGNKNFFGGKIDADQIKDYRIVIPDSKKIKGLDLKIGIVYKKIQHDIENSIKEIK